MRPDVGEPDRGADRQGREARPRQSCSCLRGLPQGLALVVHSVVVSDSRSGSKRGFGV
ncbi:hypothetical protein DB32_004070 [Sandaracinus amylolyticus]|uniref:Uncharacterized protein n=1 Tax=Sandaracinus amylolyticus TaxID=927083 RepID=A0A0F6W4A3_9BACT|nr:hypothetical protein DB32_004070 [Sandaracinus amylolyticus]